MTNEEEIEKLQLLVAVAIKTGDTDLMVVVMKWLGIDMEL